MKVDELCTKSVVSISKNDKLKDAINLMISNRFHQLPVVDGEFEGIVNLKDIALSNMDAEKTKVSKFVVRVPTLVPGEGILEAAEKILNSGMRALPVLKGGKLYGILSESDIIKTAEGINVNDIISRPVITISKDDTIGKARKILKNENISRLPVVDDGKVVGIVSDMDMAKTLIKSEREMSPEKVPTMDLPVETIMSKANVVEFGESFEKVKKHMESQDECIFVKNGEPIGIITARDILEKMIPPKKFVKVNFINFEEVDDFDMEKINDALERFVSKMSKIFDIDTIFLHMKTYEVDGNRKKYSLRARVYTSDGLFIAKTSEWSALSAVQDITEKLERIMKKKHDKEVS